MYHRRRRCSSCDRRRQLLMCVSMIATKSISASTKSMIPSLKSSPGGSLPGYMMTKIEQKGMGLVATRKMDVGTMVITESPLLTLRTGFREPEGQAALASLSSTEEQEQIMALHDCRAISPMEKSMVGIFQTNALPLGLNAHRGGIFPKMARINHSCLPNMNYYFNEETFMGEMYAIRTINVGDELSWAYTGSPLDTCQIRQQYLKNAFAFDCTCPCCSLSPAMKHVSDERRNRLKFIVNEIKTALLCEVHARIAEGGEEERDENCSTSLFALDPLVSLVSERLELLHEEDLATPMQMLLYHYDTYSLLTKAGGRQKEAQMSLKQAIMFARLSQGPHSRTSKRLQMLQVPPS